MMAIIHRKCWEVCRIRLPMRSAKQIWQLQVLTTTMNFSMDEYQVDVWESFNMRKEMKMLEGYELLEQDALQTK